MEIAHHGLLSRVQRASQWQCKLDCVDLWLVEWSAPELWRALPESFQAHWSPAQRARLASISNPLHQRRYAWTQLWMASILKRYLPDPALPVKIHKDAAGRPHLALAGAPSFSLSHCEHLVLLAVDPQGLAIGVDLEPEDPKRAMQGIVSRFFSPGDQQRFSGLSASQQLRVFYWWWTAKEALGKASGQGITTELLSLELPMSPGSGVQCVWAGADYRLDGLGSWKGRRGALGRALRRQSAPLRGFWLSQRELTSL